MTDATADRVETLCETIGSLDDYTDDKPTLVYFDIIGIAWPIRCLLHLNKVDYHLVQISIREWGYRDDSGVQLLKRAFGNGHVPLYVDKDVRLNQSNVIMLYLARKYSMAGKTPAEELAAMQVMAHAYDALFHWNGLLQTVIKIAIDDDVVQARFDSFMGKGTWGIVTNGYRNHLNGFTDYLEANDTQSGFFVGDALTIADLHAFNILCNWYKALDRQTFTTEYPALEAYIQRIAAIPGVADYIATRQEPTVWFNLPQAAIRLTSPEELAGLIG